MRRILVAVDESEASARAAAFVNDFFGGTDTEVIAIHVGRVALPWYPAGVVPGTVFAWPYPPVPWETDPASPGRTADEELQAGQDAIRRSGVDEDDSIVELGDVVDSIREAAVDRDVGLIVVGTRHAGFLDRLLSGSVSRDLVADSPRPVLVVP